VRQMLNLQSRSPVYFFTMFQLQQFHAVLSSRAQEMTATLKRIGVPPELHLMIMPNDVEFKILWGFMPPTGPPQPQPQPGFNAAGPPPTGPPHMQPTVHHNVPSTPIPIPASMSTPAPSHPAPTPPHLTTQGPPNPLSQRRHAFAEGAGSMSSPNHQLSSPAPVPAPTPPAGTMASSPRRASRPRPNTQRGKRTSKAANTPTPAADAAPTPATAPTPAATLGMKRPLDEADTPSGQSDAPTKRPKTEPSPSPAPVTVAALPMVKAPTPPPQISSDIDPAHVKTEESAKLLLDATFTRAENEAETAAAGGAEPNAPDLLQWLSQLISITDAPTASTSVLGSELTVGQTNALTGDDSSSFDDIFDLDRYYAADKDGPAMPELDHTKHATVSPESHNDVTTTPPSQTNGPGRATGSSEKGVPIVKREQQVDLDTDFLSFHDDTLFAFSYSEPVNPLEDAWAIAQG
jgi:hypothetical protein